MAQTLETAKVELAMGCFFRVQSKVVGDQEWRSPLSRQTRQFSLTEGGVTTRKKVVSLETKKGSVFKELNQLITLP